MTAQEIIKILLDEYNVSDLQLAMKLDVHPTTIKRWLDGTHSPKIPIVKYLEAILRGYKSQSQGVGDDPK